MQIVNVEVFIKAPVEEVFKLIEDHASYSQYIPITSSRLLKQGNRYRNGTGAVRKLSVFPFDFIESITFYDPPVQLSYHVDSSTIPLKDQYGTIKLMPENDGTLVHWETGFNVDVPLIESVMAPIGAFLADKVFTAILEGMKARLEK